MQSVDRDARPLPFVGSWLSFRQSQITLTQIVSFHGVGRKLGHKQHATGFVYMLRALHDFKLGRSVDPLVRLVQVAGEGEIRLSESIKFAFPSSRRALDAESSAKHLLAPHRSRFANKRDGYTEWFHNDAWSMALRQLALYPEAIKIPLAYDGEFTSSAAVELENQHRKAPLESPAVSNVRRADRVQSLFRWVPNAIGRASSVPDRTLLLESFRPLWTKHGSRLSKESEWDLLSETARRQIIDLHTYRLRGQSSNADSMVERISYGSNEESKNNLTIVFQRRSKIERVPCGEYVWQSILQILQWKAKDDLILASATAGWPDDLDSQAGTQGVFKNSL